MADQRFFTNAGPLRLSDIAALTGAVLQPPECAALSVNDVAPLDKAAQGAISFLDNVKYLDAFAASRAGACFVRRKFAARAPQGMAILVTEEPYTAYALVAQAFYPEASFAPGV